MEKIMKNQIIVAVAGIAAVAGAAFGGYKLWKKYHEGEVAAPEATHDTAPDATAASA